MSEEEPKRADEEQLKQKVPSLLRNYVSFAGIAVVAASFTSIVLLILMELSGGTENPYTDLITFVFVPSILVFGLFIVLVGALLERRRRRANPEAGVAQFPVLDLNDPQRRRSLLVFMILAFVFLFMSAFGSYRAYEYTESVTFCGQACHVVMKPEFVAYKASPHAKVRCVECHVGGGAEWYVRSKFSGMRQLYGVITNDYNRPIQTPVHNMRSATETCQKCHWSEKFHGDKLRVFNHYGYDEQNSLNQTRMLIKVGGGSSEGGQSGGIHWHMNVANEITYVAADDKLKDIPWVRMKGPDGKVVEFTAKDASLSSSQIEEAPKRTMNCIDCHNRPTHIYLSPNQAIDEALTANRIDITLPYIKMKAVEVLSKPYATNDEAVTTIAADLNSYYQANHADVLNSRAEAVNAAITEVQRIYQTYFFPEMKTNWSTHANNIGHYNAQGCFRCHDGQQSSKEGKVIRNECSICHTTLDQTFGGKTIAAKDGAFQHPVNLGDKNTFQCAACHKGDQTFKHPLNLGDISQFQCSECHKGSYEPVRFQRPNR
ncbi:MAG: NapC/NirT family cytochrome c [bacterium]|nr:NapC/NirT family cytochrome c [bacterium]